MEKQNQQVICNCCGKQITLEPKTEREDYLFVEMEWGFFSKKDGEIHRFVLCESCYDRWRDNFAVPVEIRMQTELL